MFCWYFIRQKTYISVYDISYKTSTGPKPLRIRFDKIDEFIRTRDDKFRHLVLFGHGLLDKICDKIKYLISKKSDITDSIDHNFGEIRIIHIIFCLLKKYWLLIVLCCSLSQLLIRIKTTTTIYFQKKVCMKINPIHDIFKYVFVYYKWYI